MLKKRFLFGIISGILITVLAFVIYVAVNKNAYNTNGNISTTLEPSVSPKPTDENKIAKTLKITAAGDILLGRGVEYHIKQLNESYNYPFESIRPVLKYGDVIFANLEEPFTDSTKSLWGKIILKSEPEAISGVKYAGFNLLSLANNHILDYYTKGLYDTIKLLNRENIAYAGAGTNLENARELTIIEKNGLKIGLLAYSEMAYEYYTGDPSINFAATKDSGGVAPYKVKYINEDIKKARANVDILIVSLHFGVEYSLEPQERQVKEVHSFIDSGADIIIGHHTHRSQGIEIYKGKPIFYSLGNLLFDQDDPLNQRSFIINMKFTDNKLTSLSAIPFLITDKCRILRATGDVAKEMIENEQDLCEKLNSKCTFYKNTLKFVL